MAASRQEAKTRVRRADRRGPRPPGLHGWRLARSTLFERDLLALISRTADTYGEISRFDVLRKPFFLLSAPEHAEHVLVAHNDRYVKSFDYRLLAVVTGKGLLTNEGDEWVRQRRLVQPMFSARHLARFSEHMVDASDRMLDRWERLPDGSQVDVASAMSGLTLDIVGRSLFGAELSGDAARIGPAVTVGLRTAITFARIPFLWLAPDWSIRLGAAILFRLPIPRLRRIHRAITTLDEVFQNIISERMARPGVDPGDLLGLLLAARDAETGEGMSRRQVRDELATFLLAGHETTANGLAWTWYLLSHHREARDRLFDEVDSVLGGRPPTFDDVEKLPWTTAVFNESMRLYPPAWIIERDAVAADEIAGYPVPRGSTVIIPPYLVHRNPRVWPRPEAFEPERFLPENAAGRHRHAFMPFGAGRRICVGAGFATMEGTIAAAMIAQRFTLDLVPGAKVVPEPTATLRPRDELPMTLHRRTG